MHSFLNVGRIHRLRDVVLFACVLVAPAAAQTSLFGSIYNFDVYNDTGRDAHGFEIELDGLSTAQAYYNFSSTRYGAPTVVPFNGGVNIRWAATYNVAAQQWSATTTQPAAFTPTTGHSCVLTFINGCDHYGTSNSAGATAVKYYWLVEDLASPGALVRYGTGVSIPQPTISIIPPAQPQNPPVVVFEAKLPDPAVQQFSDAKWVKVFKTELNREVGLDELVGDNPVVPQDPGLVETAWKLLQVNRLKPGSGVLKSSGSPSAGSHSIIRRYEFYKYTGKYDPLTHEALCSDPLCNTPAANEIGDYVGDQMAAANIGVPSVTVTKTGGGTVTGANGKINCGGACTAIVAANTNVDLVANPGGAFFTGWGGACNGTQLTCSLAVNDALNVTATFIPIYTLSIGRSGNGTVSGNPAGLQDTLINCGGNCSAKFAEGTSVTLTAVPAAGQNFTGWSGSCSGTVPSCSVIIAADTKVQANFK